MAIINNRTVRYLAFSLSAFSKTFFNGNEIFSQIFFFLLIKKNVKRRESYEISFPLNILSNTLHFKGPKQVVKQTKAVSK